MDWEGVLHPAFALVCISFVWIVGLLNDSISTGYIFIIYMIDCVDSTGHDQFPLIGCRLPLLWPLKGFRVQDFNRVERVYPLFPPAV